MTWPHTRVSAPGSGPNHATAGAARPVREYLAALDQSEVEKSPPKSISLTDPAAQLSVAWGPESYAYSVNYLIDIAAGIVVDVEATPAHKSDEINATKTMIEWVEDRFHLKPDSLIGDTNYGTAELLGWMVDEKQIEPHVSVWDKTQRNDDTLSRGDFQWDEPTDQYHCPQGHVLRRQWRPFKNLRTHVTRAGTIIYRSRQAARHAR